MLCFFKLIGHEKILLMLQITLKFIRENAEARAGAQNKIKVRSWSNNLVEMNFGAGAGTTLKLHLLQYPGAKSFLLTFRLAVYAKLHQKNNGQGCSLRQRASSKNLPADKIRHAKGR